MTSHADDPNPDEPVGPSPAGGDFNPFAAPLETAPTSHQSDGSPLDGMAQDPFDDERNLQRGNLFIAIGVILVAAAFGLYFFLGLGPAALLVLFQMAWVFTALRFFSRYGRTLPLLQRISFGFLLVFHVVTLTFAVLAVLLFATCIALFTAAGN